VAGFDVGCTRDRSELAVFEEVAGRFTCRLLRSFDRVPFAEAQNFTSEAKERWTTDFKILLQRRDVVLPRERNLVGQVHVIKRRVLPSGKVSFDAERNTKGHADKFWAVALACQQERVPPRRSGGNVAVRILG
jgi:phage FluMu gp28-like protein